MVKYIISNEEKIINQFITDKKGLVFEKVNETRLIKYFDKYVYYVDNNQDTKDDEIKISIYDEDAWSKNEKLETYIIPLKYEKIKSYETKFLSISMGDADYEMNQLKEKLSSIEKILSV